MRKQRSLSAALHSIFDSLITRYIGILLLVVILPFFLVLHLLSNESTEVGIQRTADDMLSGLKFVTLSIDTLLENVEALHANLLLDDDLIKLVRDLPSADSPTSYELLQGVRKIKEKLKNIAARNSAIRNVYLYSLDPQRLFISNINSQNDYSAYDLSGQSWFTDFNASNSYPRWVLTSSIESDDRILSSYRLFSSIMLSLNVSESVISNSLNTVNPCEYADCFIVDSSGSLLLGSGTDANMARKVVEATETATSANGPFIQAIGGKRYLIQRIVSDYTNFSFIMYTDVNNCISFSATMDKIYLLYVLDSLLLVFMAILLTYVIVIKPIKYLSNQMKNTGEGNLSIRLKEHGSNEISQIYHRFNQMNASIGELIENNYINEIKRKNFRIKLLGTQINEHFLYNALDAIRWTACREGCIHTGESIRSLASFYRISLSYGSDTIPVSDLNLMINRYLEIQRLLLDGSMNFDVSIDEALFDIRVPKYLFIPLVDNAIQHGIKGCKDGVVCVSLEIVQDMLRFVVTDNGHGIADERLHEIQNALRDSDSEISDCFALRNVNAQLCTYFKISEGIHIRTRVGVGTSVWFDIPLKAVHTYENDDR